LPENRGTYLLFLSTLHDINLSIGALGSFSFKRGNYIYIGSALGPGGLDKRLSRHLKQEKKIFWHIDYLLQNEFVNIIAFGEIHSDQKIECSLVEQIIKIFEEKTTNIKNFGSSDCKCKSHLLFFIELTINELTNRLVKEMESLQLTITQVM
jgi:Uri superfamily endonuclease